MLGGLAIFTVGLGLAYSVLTSFAGVRLEGRHRRRSRRAAPVESAGGAPPAEASVFFLVACLNEEAVIAETVERLLIDDRARVVVVDDGSDDATGRLASGFDPARVVVLRRELPAARQGKGKALNHGFAAIGEIVEREQLDPARVLVCVMDADGQLSRGCLDRVLPLFDDPTVGGAQLVVRIRNRQTLLCLVQDIEFYGLTATCQMGRVATGTVSLGGNGQFTRLSALNGLAGDPWSESLTEDLDLTISLLAHGWRLVSTPDAHVTQQGVTRIRPLVKQRTRWYQGHMQCIGRLPELWKAPQLSHGAVLEITAYLAVPWVQVLPWSILFHLGAWQAYLAVAGSGWAAFGTALPARILGLGLWYLLLFLPSIASGYLYFRRARSMSVVRAIALGHLSVLSAYVSFFSCWRALGRIVAGRRGWDKTERVGEVQHAAAPVPVAGRSA